MLRGALLMLQFLEGNNATKAISWLDTYETKANLAVNPLTTNDLANSVYRSIVDNKYLFLGIFVVMRNIFGSSRFKLVSNAWVAQISPVIFSLYQQFSSHIYSFAPALRSLVKNAGL